MFWKKDERLAKKNEEVASLRKQLRDSNLELIQQQSRAISAERDASQAREEKDTALARCEDEIQQIVIARDVIIAAIRRDSRAEITRTERRLQKRQQELRNAKAELVLARATTDPSLRRERDEALAAVATLQRRIEVLSTALIESERARKGLEGANGRLANELNQRSDQTQRIRSLEDSLYSAQEALRKERSRRGEVEVENANNLNRVAELEQRIRDAGVPESELVQELRKMLAITKRRNSRLLDRLVERDGDWADVPPWQR